MTPFDMGPDLWGGCVLLALLAVLALRMIVPGPWPSGIEDLINPGWDEEESDEA